MFSIIIAIMVAAAGWFSVYYGFASHPSIWATLAGVTGFIAVSVTTNLIIRKKLERIFKDVQEHILNAQEKLRRKVSILQNKMQGSTKLQAKMEQEQAGSIREAIGMLEATTPLEKWNILVRKQVNTLKAQLYFQIREYNNADPLLEKAFVMDPITLAMKMTRFYKKDEQKKLDKAYKKGIVRFKDEKGILIYALYSWILVKQKRIEDAIAVLEKGKDKTESPVLQKNWEYLVNGRIKRFSNAGIGDNWYTLHLETPVQQRIQAQMPFGGRPSRKGFR